jgi:hypothetical protein
LREGICRTIEAITQVCKTYDLTISSIRLCVGAMLCTRFDKGSFPNRSEACLMIASELKKAGKNEEKALEILTDWNEKNIKSKKYSEIKSAVGTAFRRDYNYTCINEKLKAFCIGEDVCTFSRYLKGRTGKYYNNRKFFEFDWQNILSNSAKDVYYLALPELERRKGVGAGGLIIANQMEISRYAGVTRKSVRNGLSELQIVGLIEYKPGVSRKWEFKAGEIRRIIPIPKPHKVLLERREK